MKIVQIFGEFRKATEIVINVITYPGQVIYQRVRYIVEGKIAEVELPIGQDQSSDRNSDTSKHTNQKIKKQNKHSQNLANRNSQNLKNHSNLNSNGVKPKQLSSSKTDDPHTTEEFSTAEIPALTEGQEIRGRKGKYRCLGEIVKEEETFRVYKGFHVQTNKSILIKEYLLLDRNYNRKERKICKEKFAEINKINFRKGSTQDFRIISPFEAIAPPRENRCYLITEPVNNSITLKEYLENEGSLSPKQIVDILDQILQTLWFLSTNRIRLPSGEIQNGMAHGNLNLNTISIVTSQQYSSKEEPQLFAYVCDLAVWEHIFLPPNSPLIKTSFAKDSIDLGNVCFHLLSEKIVNTENGKSLNIKHEEQWPFIDSTLEAFIRRLLGINSQFESALSARQELLKLRQNEQFEYQNQIVPSDEIEEEEKKKITKLTLIIAGILLLGITGLIGAGSYWIFSRIFIKQPSAYGDRPKDNANLCCLNKVEIPIGEFTYAVDRAMWGNIFKRQGIVSSNKTLKQELESREPRFKNYKVNNSNKDPIAAIKNGKIDFALTRWNNELPEGLEQKIVAYNGLVVFVAYSDEQRQQNIPKALKGKISLEKLRRLYSEGRKSWKTPRELEGWDIKLYVPFTDSETKLFEELVFDRNNRRQINDYKDLVETIIFRQTKELRKSNIEQLNTRHLLEQISEDFETERTIGIGFSYLSTIFGQCAVYPLAIVNEHQTIQTLVKTNGKSISPTTDLCNDKGGYWQNVEAFKTGKYPLGYNLVVVYPKNKERSAAGEKFVELLRTDEGQYLLREAGLVPLRKLP